MMIQPTIDMAQDYSKSRIAPMLRDTKVLNNLFYTVKDKEEFGTAKIEDQGIWIDTAIFSTKFEFFPWNKIKLSRGNGEFLIATKDGKNEVGLWYESEWNVHMLEALMRVAFDKGYTRLSQVMG